MQTNKTTITDALPMYVLLSIAAGLFLLGQFLGHVDADRCIEATGRTYNQCRALNG